MRVYKNGICREIDQKREQEFREKGYVIEGKETTDIVEVLKQENEALKAENEALKQEIEALKAHTGGEKNATTNATTTNGHEATAEVEQIKTTARGRK